MKKIWLLLELFEHKRRKILYAMRLSVFFIVFFSFSVSARVVAQQEKVSLDLSGVSLQALFQEIQKQTNLYFVYNEEQCRDFGQVTVQARNETVRGVLDRILKDKHFTYRFEDGIIVIKAVDKYVPQTQGRKISGRVTDRSGNPLPGVSVTIKGASVGVATDIDGKYVLECPVVEDLTLKFSFLGMVPQEIPVGAKNEIDVSMAEAENRLEEVVAIGYGTKKVKDMTGTVSRISSKELETVPMGSTLQSMLQGKASGVNVMIGSASPTAPVSVIIRGASSLSGNSQPLWVIDGVPQYDSSDPEWYQGEATYDPAKSGGVASTLYSLNLNDVECVDILKDASATAIYGSRAANGVVLVTTKRGKAGMNPQLEFSARYGIQVMHSNKFKMLDADQYIAMSKAANREYLITMGKPSTARYIDEAYYNRMINHSQFDRETLTDDFFQKTAYYDGNMDWWDFMTQNAATQEYSLALRGGSQSSSYSASIFYKDQDGVVKGGNTTLVGGSFNFDTSIRDIIRYKMNLRAASRKADNKDNMMSRIRRMRPDMPAYNEDGTINTIDFFTKNPLLVLQDKNLTTSRDFSGTLGLEWDIIRGLTLKTTGTARYIHSKTDIYNRKYYDGDDSEAKIGENEAYTYIWDNTLNYVNTFGQHNIVGLLGFSMEKYESEGFSASGSKFPDDDVLTDLGSASSRDDMSSSYFANTLVSAFARIDYKFKNRYLLTANMRIDGSSRFGPDKRWGYFPSAAVAWVVSEEEFLKDYSNIVSYLKLRFSIGKTGSQNLGNYDWRTSMGSAIYDGKPGIQPATLGNRSLQWESQRQTEFGLDYGFWEDRVRGSFGYYRKYVDNLLYSNPIAYSSSFTEVTQNIGALKNKGVEFDIKVDIIRNTGKDLTWSFDLNIAHNTTTLEKLNDFDTYFGGGSGMIYKIEEGGKTGQFYGYKDMGRLFLTNEEIVALKTINPNTGKQVPYRNTYEHPGDTYIMDVDGDGKVNTTDHAVALGNANPDFFGGFGTTLIWKGLMVNATFAYSVGADRFWFEEMKSTGDISTFNISNIALKSWIFNPGVNTAYPRVTYSNLGANGIYTDRFIHDASYLRLTALNLSYRLPKQWFKNTIIGSVDFTFQATNLFTWTNYPGMDPQGNFSLDNATLYSMGMDYSNYPAARTYNFGIKLTLK